MAHRGYKTFRRLMAIALFLGSLAIAFGVINTPVSAVVGTNEQINFQGRLFNGQGAVVPDGYYNIEFKIYQDGTGTVAGNPSGTLKWTESHLNNNSQGVQVKNGYMSVELGSVNAFASQVDWNQSVLWLSMNIGNTNATCTPFSSCAPDGEMLPMKRLSSSVYAMNAGKLGGLTSAGFIQNTTTPQTANITIQSSADNAITASLQGRSTQSAATLLLKQGSSQTGAALSVVDSSNADIFKIDAFGSMRLYTSSAQFDKHVAIGDSTSSGIQLLVTAAPNAQGISVNSAQSGTTQTVLNVRQHMTGDTADILSTNSTGTQTNGLMVRRNAAGGTTDNGINITNSAGTMTNGVSFNGTIGTDINRSSGTLSANGSSGIRLATNGVDRATLDTSNNIYFGNGVTAAAPNNFAIRGTGSSTTGVAGGALTVQGGNATVGNANGGNITLSGGTGFGTGVSGLVVLTTPTFQTTANDANCYTSGALVASSCTMTTTSVNNSSAVIIGFSTTGQTATMPDPTTTTAGRVVYVTAANTSQDFTLSVNGGGTGNQIAMRQNTTATMIWNGADWTAAGASSSTTLQAAYDNTLTSAGGAELLLSNGSNANGLTIRDSSTNPVNGTLLEVQNSSAANLLSVNSNVTEYASNAGAETSGGTSTTFPASTWTAISTTPTTTVSRHATAGNYVATGQGSVSVVTGAAVNGGVKNQLVNSAGSAAALTANTNYNVSFTTRLLSGTFTDMNVYYSIDGTAASVACTTSATSATSVWSKVNCSFTTPSSGITTGNAILIRQTTATARTFYVDNLSVTIAADYNFATDGNVSDGTNFATNWSYSTGIGTGSVTRNTGDGYNASDSAQVAISSGAANAGLRNQLSSNPLPNTLYRMTVYAKLSTGSFTDFKIRYSRDGGTTYADCVDYNTQTITTTAWTKVTCYIQTDGNAATSPYVYFVETTSAARTYMVDAFSMTLRTSTTPNVQIGGGVNGGPTTLLTLDKGASAPIASDNDALLGSMYYDTTLGKLQCYEADGWGACGSSPDNVVTISPEYTNAVLHGTGIGTMTSDICSDTLNLNDGSSSQPTICGTNETYNFYKWTSPQASAQTYGIYVTYQLPSTFKEFASGQTSLMGRTDSANSTVSYQVYRSDATGLTACGSAVTVSTGAQTTWQTVTASGAADPSTCSFDPSDSIVFRINVTASNTANAYVGNLNFIFSNR